MPPKILLFGSGAIGTIYVYLLLRAACDVTAVCRSNYTAALREGFRIDSDLYGADLRISPRVVRDCAEAAESARESGRAYDYILIAAKALPSARIPELIAPAVEKGRTTIVLIQNGIDIEAAYAERFPENALLTCVVTLPTTQIAPGKVQMGNNERLEVGPYFATESRSESSRSGSDASAMASAEIQREQEGKVRKAGISLVETLKAGGSNAEWVEQVQERRWLKLLLNAPWNPICALTVARDVAVLGAADGAEEVVFGVMGEVVAVAQALGHTAVTVEAAQSQLDRAKKGRLGTKGIEPSMLVDVLNGRRTEVEVILGNPVKIAKRLGIAVPRLEMLYALMKVLDESIALRKSGESLSGEDVAAAVRL